MSLLETHNNLKVLAGGYSPLARGQSRWAEPRRGYKPDSHLLLMSNSSTVPWCALLVFIKSKLRELQLLPPPLTTNQGKTLPSQSKGSQCVLPFLPLIASVLCKIWGLTFDSVHGQCLLPEWGFPSIVFMAPLPFYIDWCWLLEALLYKGFWDQRQAQEEKAHDLLRMSDNHEGPPDCRFIVLE